MERIACGVKERTALRRPRPNASWEKKWSQTASNRRAVSIRAPGERAPLGLRPLRRGLRARVSAAAAASEAEFAAGRADRERARLALQRATGAAVGE